MYKSAFSNARYKCIKKIGQGGTSAVYLCVDNHINQKWAVKILYNSYYFDEKTNLNLIDTEIELLKSFDYYMFPRIVDAFSEDGYVGIVTDYIEGESLKSYIRREGPLPINVALGYFSELLRAIIYLHSQSPPILYLDMKPDNIMVKPDGTIRLIDFGIASSILLKSKSYGTVGYSPPEQYIKDGKLTEKADVFALAMTLYTMLTGIEPDKNLSTQINHIKRSKKIPKTIKDLIINCTKKDDKKRFSTKDIMLFLEGKKIRIKSVVPTLLFTVITIFILCTTTYLVTEYIQKTNHKRYKTEMISRASRYIENGDYTNKGIKIICGYLDGNFLDDETAEYFTYEVAKNYYEVQKDYASARTYFSRLNKEKYPAVEEYIKRCDQMRKFTSFDNEIKELMNIEK